jgi:hypothetical protein
LLDKAFEALNATEGMKVVWDCILSWDLCGFSISHNHLFHSTSWLNFRFEKPDDMPHVIVPHLEKWGYLKGEGMRIEMKQCDKKGVGFTGGEQK